MQQSASLDLRVNTLKATPDEVIEELTQHGVQAEKGQYSPECVRLNIKPALTQWPIYKEGKVDVQDEGSQLLVWFSPNAAKWFATSARAPAERLWL